MSLQAARIASDVAFRAFRQDVTRAGFSDEWRAYEAHEANPDSWPPALDAAWRAYSQALHAFYAMRDGPAGFLGRRCG